jgi:hypothetical protein
MTKVTLWAVAIVGATYWMASEILAGRWSWRRVDLRRAAHLLRDMRERERRARES